jgi:hypothetical protein
MCWLLRVQIDGLQLVSTCLLVSTKDFGNWIIVAAAFTIIVENGILKIFTRHAPLSTDINDRAPWSLELLKEIDKLSIQFHIIEISQMR